MVRIYVAHDGNIFVFHMSAPLIGIHTHSSHAHLVPPTFCGLNMSAHQESDSNLICVHDNFQLSRFIAPDPNTWKCPPMGVLMIMLFGNLQSAEIHACEAQDLDSIGASSVVA